MSTLGLETTGGRYAPAHTHGTFEGYRDVPVAQQPFSNDPAPYSTIRNFVSHVATLRPSPIREAYIHPGSNVLEIGPGTGNYTTELLDAGHTMVAADISTRQLKDLRATVARRGTPGDNLTTMTADVVDLPLADASVDAVVCFGGPVSYVFDAAPTAIAEMLRVTRPGGHILLSVMTPGWIELWAPKVIHSVGEAALEEMRNSGDVYLPSFVGEGGHLFRTYTPEKLRDLLERHECTVVDMMASYVSDVSDLVPVDQYAKLCHEPDAMVSTGGYLIAVARKPSE